MSHHQLARFSLVMLACAWLAAPRDGWAWRMREHRAIGAESYTAACNRLEPHKDRDSETELRYEVACGNVQLQSFLYGQAASVSGDFLSEPGQFITALGASVVTLKSNYYRLALTNSAHFHPLATREWRVFHQQAIASALAAARTNGDARLAGFEQAFYESAFGDHFLQDSFAAGHMGFNRPASSAAAAKVFHDEWNESGRWVANRRGEVWKTFGDGRLDHPDAREGREHVISAATESVYGVLAAFVLGAYDPAPDYAVWRQVVFTIEDRELLPDLETLFAGSATLTRPNMMPVLAIKRPAVKDGVLGAWSSLTVFFDDPVGTVVGGGELVIPKLGTRLEVGAGIGFAGSFDNLRFALDAGHVTELGVSWDGLLGHEIDLSGLFLIGGDVDVALRLGYRANIEAGDWLLRVSLGPSLDAGSKQLGLYTGLGIVKVTGAAGGAFF